MVTYNDPRCWTFESPWHGPIPPPLAAFEMTATRAVTFLSFATFALTTSLLEACPFCSAVVPPLRVELAAMDAVVIATAMETDPARHKETNEVLMKVVKVLKGGGLVQEGQEFHVIYYGDNTVGRRFMLTGVDPPKFQWSCSPLSKRAETYVAKIVKLGDDPVQRLRFYRDYLRDKELMLARDAYDEFASESYAVIKKVAPEMDHDQLIDWISDPDMPTDHKRLFLTILGIRGDEKDLPQLEKMLRSTQKSSRGGLDALIACYLTLAGETGLPLMNELFLANKKAPYADTYAAIMAIRFHGTEGDVIPRSALVESLHHVLDRADLADLVIPDLARWSDWSQIDRLTQLFIDAEADNNWVRVPVVNYLRACPEPAAKEALKKLEKVDPESVRRANTFFSIPVPARDTGSSSSALPSQSNRKVAASTVGFGKPGQRIAANAVPSVSTTVAAVLPMDPAQPMNSWRLAYVLSLAMATVMIAQFLLLAGGPQPTSE